jgi:HK97 family phage prohead protease
MALGFATAPSEAPSFAIDETAIDPAIFGLTAYASPTAISPRVDRRTARQVPAVKRGRDLICGTLGGLPIDLIGPDMAPAVSTLFTQPEKNVARSVTMIKTFEDLFYDERAWWQILEVGWHGFPTSVKRLDPRKVDHDEDSGKVYFNGRHVPDKEIIRFDSPTDGILTAGARAIRTALNLDVAASNGAAGTPPVDYFVPVDESDPLEDDEITDLLGDWSTARQNGRTAYVPAALEYKTAGWNPEQLQLAAQRQHAVLEIARLVGLDPEDLGVAITSRTYANAETRRRDLLDFTLSAYLISVADRLSMPDVTPRGYYAKFNLDAFLRSDTLQRYQAYEVGLRVGAVTKPEIRVLEDRPPLGDDQEDTDVPEAEPTALPPAASRELRIVGFDDETGAPLTFDTAPELRLDAPGAQAFEVDVEKRTIRGLLVPFGVAARSKGQLWQFAKGSLRWSSPERVKLWIQHDPNRAVGHAFELDERDDGLYGAFKVARGAAGDEALSMAEDKVWDGFSIGIGEGGRYRRRDQINHAVEAPLMETSLTPVPSFDDARVHAVAASATPHQGDTMPETTEVVVDEAPTTEQAGGPADFSPITQAVTQAIGAGFAARETVDNRVESVTEAPPYRFDGVRGDHDFSSDIIQGLKFGDGEARERVERFIAEAFAPSFDVDTTDAAGLNPTRQRPDMYVDRLDYTLPFYNALHKGTLADQTPFTFPKFNTTSGLVAAHTEGVEPTPGAFTATSQTVTPTAVSGKVEITREVWDQGGNPQVSALIWNEMKRAYFESLEASAVAVLDAASPTAIALTTAAADDDLVNELEAAIASLQFIRGGMRFNFMGTHIDLYKRLAAAVDSTGRKLLPILNPTNANGSSSARFQTLDVAGVTATPAWGLGAAGAVSESSYLVSTSDVHVWNSVPQRLEFQYRVAYVDLAIWGYVATAISRLDGVREVTYDPTA